MNDDEILDKMIEALATISEGCRMNSDDKGVCCKDCKLARIVFNDDIEYDVPFNIVIKPTIGETDFDTVYIHKDDNMYIGFTLNYADTDEVVEGDRFDIIDLLFADNVKIVKKPWKPKKNEKYYFINAHNNIEYDWFDNTFVCDRYRYITGNFFKTYNEAEKHKDEVLKIFAGEPLVKWED